MSQTIIEKCSCGATITATGSAYRSDRSPNNPRGVEEIVERWRVEHKHEVAVAPSNDKTAARAVLREVAGDE